MNAEVKPIFNVPIISINLDGMSDQLGLENIIRDEIENNPNAHSPEHIYQSYPYLHEKESVALFVNSIRENVRTVSEQVYQYKPDYEIDITAMWANVQKPGKSFKRHVHRNNIFAGVFYANGGKDLPPIQFFNSLQPQFAPATVKSNSFNSGIWTEDCQKDTLLIFPAWLNHQVGNNKSDRDRLSISFNVMLRGRYGGITNLQSVVL